MENTDYKIKLKYELSRKGIHISFSLIGFIYIFLGWNVAFPLLCLALIVMVSFDIGRANSDKIQQFYHSIFLKILRSHEIDNRKSLFTGGTYLVISAFLIVLLFPMPIAVASIFIITYSDSIAAIIGKMFGRIKIFDKTLEGSISFFLSGLLIIYFSPKISVDPFEFQIAVFSLIVCTVVDVLPVKIDDNLSLPVVFSVFYFMLLKIFNLY